MPAMENKEYNTVEDFVFNKSFQEWVLNNDPYSTRFWLSWISYNPEKTSLVNYSRAIVDSLPSNKRKASEEEINELIERIISDANSQMVVLPGDLITPRPKKRVLTISSRNWLSIVAVFVLVVASTWYLITANSRYPDPYKSFASGYTHSLAEQVNHTDSVQTVKLPDGSRVLLASKSRLSYPDKTIADKREVFLTGSASFDISNDAAKPFFVYTQGTITKSAGAGFEVVTSPDNKTTIEVRRSNVQVFKRKDINEGGPRLYKVTGIVVTPNQLLVFNEETSLLYKSLTAVPLPVMQTPKPFRFVNEPAVKIFSQLQDSYAIPILFDRDAFSHCLITIEAGAASFFEQLAAVCEPLHASYEVVDGNVLITGKGCGK